MKSVKSSSGIYKALVSVLEAGGALFSWGFSTLLLSKNTCHLFEFYLQYPTRYRYHVLRRHPQHLDDQAHLLVLVLSTEERVSEM